MYRHLKQSATLHFAHAVYSLFSYDSESKCYYFSKQHQPIYVCNGEVLCFLCGTDWIFKYYSDELRLQKVVESIMEISASNKKSADV
jgi:hypothetical protein